MLVDLGRNDLGRVCEYGSVEVETFMAVETYSHLIHIVSSVAGRLRPERRAAGRAALDPPGRDAVGRARRCARWRSSTSSSRSSAAPYGGAVGYVSYTGELDTCICIRTVVIRDGVAHMQAGGGTVADAKPDYEYEESRNKARAVARAIELATQPRGLAVTRVLVIDNYDSFTYNLVQYLGELGAELEVVRNDVEATGGAARAPARPRDRVAGPVHPERGGRVGRGDAALPRGGHPVARRLPRPPVARPGVRRHGRPPRARARQDDGDQHDGEGVFAGLPSPLTVGRYHSLVVDPDLPGALRVTATGGGVVMAVQHRELPAIGVQFHPESVLTPDGKQLLRNFLAQPGPD